MRPRKSLGRKRLGSKDGGGEGEELRLRALPCVRGEAEFLGAEALEELLLGPAGLARHLRQKATRAPAVRQVDAVVEQVEIERMLRGAQRREHADLEFERRQTTK